MTIDWRRYGWQPGYTAAFFAIGLPYWQIPYHKVNLPDALPGAGLVVLFAVTVLTRLYSGKFFMRATLVLGAAALAGALPGSMVLRISRSRRGAGE